MKIIVVDMYLLGDDSNKAALTRVTSMKDLGVIFDSKPKSEEKINNKINKASAILRIFFEILNHWIHILLLCYTKPSLGVN